MKQTLNFTAKWFLVFFIMSILSFGIVRLMPVSPVQMLLTSRQLPATEENIHILEKEWGLDAPIPVQYFRWITHFAKGDWGKSFLTSLDIREEMGRRIPYSLTIGLGGVLIAAVTAFFAGYAASLKDGGFWDVLTRFIAIFTQSVPTFVLAVILIYFIGVKYNLVRVFTGSGTLGLLLATFFVALSSFGSLSRIVRSHFKTVMEEPYIKFAISRGFEPKKILLTEGYPQALCGLLSALVAKFSWVIGGTTVVEFVFAVPGISYFLVQSVLGRDYNVIQSYLMLIVLWMFGVHLFLNTALNSLDPRRCR